MESAKSDRQLTIEAHIFFAQSAIRALGGWLAFLAKYQEAGKLVSDEEFMDEVLKMSQAGLLEYLECDQGLDFLRAQMTGKIEEIKDPARSLQDDPQWLQDLASKLISFD